MERKRVVIESPLKGDFLTNRRYATWCCRHMHEAGYSPLASHLVAPWFMDDRDAEDRAAGFDMPWFWLPDVPHAFFTDFGMSPGMDAALHRCRAEFIPTIEEARLPPEHLKRFLKGEWPPHTPGFGPDEAAPPGWCDPDHQNFDRARFEQALVEQEEYERTLTSEEEAQTTVDLIENLRKILNLPPKSAPPSSR